MCHIRADDHAFAIQKRRFLQLVVGAIQLGIDLEQQIDDGAAVASFPLNGNRFNALRQNAILQLGRLLDFAVELRVLARNNAKYNANASVLGYLAHGIVHHFLLLLHISVGYISSKFRLLRHIHVEATAVSAEISAQLHELVSLCLEIEIEHSVLERLRIQEFLAVDLPYAICDRLEFVLAVLDHRRIQLACRHCDELGVDVDAKALNGRRVVVPNFGQHVQNFLLAHVGGCGRFLDDRARLVFRGLSVQCLVADQRIHLEKGASSRPRRPHLVVSLPFDQGHSIVCQLT